MKYSLVCRKLSSAARMNLNAAANSKKPMTTLTEFIHEPLFGMERSKLGNRANTKKGEANAREKANGPRKRCSQLVTDDCDASRVMNPP